MSHKDFKENAIDILNSAGRKAKELGEWAVDNPQASVSIITSAALLLRASQSLVVNHRINKERRYQDYTYYDRSNNFRWNLRRRMTNQDRAIIESRKRHGDSTYDILVDLRLI